MGDLGLRIFRKSAALDPLRQFTVRFLLVDAGWGRARVKKVSPAP
jgi:hypothetical protein